ncbi:hypothetical protein A9K75_06565 [Campylobacter fetus subsp. testudinum]|uniref:conjugal transfer protein TraF n=1 Tax=Campylobacter fetus TaxID=196 RepID=UPI000818C684|nr:conjugal transfer protein TraF [Campylobacter fetus]OCR99528.1 hypothetical protein A9K75_06565 [Campylobacter fetus subsp. testudinum]
MKIFIVFILFLTNLFSKQFFGENKEGWFWYETNQYLEKMDQNRTLEDEKFISQIPLKDLNKLSAEEFKKTFEKVREIAVMKPTFENVQTMRIMQKFMTDQSMKFTKVFKYATLVDPDNNYNDIGEGGFSGNVLRDKKELENKAKYLTSNIIFVTFVKDQTSDIAKKQIVKNLDFRKMNIDARVFEYTTLDDQELVNRLNLKLDIENYVFKKSTKDWIVIRKSLIDPSEFIKDFIFIEDNKDDILHNKNFLDETKKNLNIGDKNEKVDYY